MLVIVKGSSTTNVSRSTWKKKQIKKASLDLKHSIEINHQNLKKEDKSRQNLKAIQLFPVVSNQLSLKLVCLEWRFAVISLLLLSGESCSLILTCSSSSVEDLN